MDEKKLAIHLDLKEYHGLNYKRFIIEDDNRDGYHLVLSYDNISIPAYLQGICLRKCQRVSEM